jgi:hypothetical protein
MPGITWTAAACSEAADVGISPAHIICLGRSIGIEAARKAEAAATEAPRFPALVECSAARRALTPDFKAPSTRGLHSSTSQLNLSRF